MVIGSIRGGGDEGAIKVSRESSWKPELSQKTAVDFIFIFFA